MYFIILNVQWNKISMTKIQFDLKEFNDKVTLYYSYNESSWYDQEEWYLDMDTGEIIKRIFRPDKYINKEHPKWEIKEVVIKGELIEDGM